MRLNASGGRARPGSLIRAGAQGGGGHFHGGGYIYCLCERGEDMRSLLQRLPPFLTQILAGQDLDALREIRVREGWPVELRGGGQGWLLGEPVGKAQLAQLVGALTEYSLYAWERQMKEGFFTLPGGFRVGVTGRYAPGGPLQAVTSVSIRLARELPQAADGLLPLVLQGQRLLSTLILSAPCLGKTTLLRALIGRLSQRGLCVAVCDERGELAGPMLGPRADVACMCDKRVAIPRLVRSLSPDVIAADELGGEGDAAAVAEAARCGAAVLATAHAQDYQAARRRPTLAAAMEAGVFRRYVVLEGAPGHLGAVLDERGEPVWTNGR